LPRASAARTAVEQRGPGHRDPCGVISRQARHTRSPWESSHASGWAAPVDRCTKRRWDTNDCRHPHPVGEAPSRRAHRDIGQNHIPEGCVGVVVQGRDRGVMGWDGTLACPSGEGSSISMVPVAEGMASRASTRVSSCNGSGSVSIGAPGGARGASRVRPRVPVDLSPPTPPGGPVGRDSPVEGEVPPELGHPNLIAPPPAAGIGTGESRRGAPARKGGAWWPTVWWRRPRVACGVEALHVPLAFHLTGPTPEGQFVRVAVRRHELRARVRRRRGGCRGHGRCYGGRGFGQARQLRGAGVQEEGPCTPPWGQH